MSITVLFLELALMIAIPLYIIFDKSFQNGSVADDWKDANVTAIFNKGSNQCAGNYHPVSLTSHAVGLNTVDYHK